MKIERRISENFLPFLFIAKVLCSIVLRQTTPITHLRSSEVAKLAKFQRKSKSTPNWLDQILPNLFLALFIRFPPNSIQNRCRCFVPQSERAQIEERRRRNRLSGWNEKRLKGNQGNDKNKICRELQRRTGAVRIVSDFDVFVPGSVQIRSWF